MKPKDLSELRLQIPTIDLVETRNILGGGYAEDGDNPFRMPGEIPYDDTGSDDNPIYGGELDEIIVTETPSDRGEEGVGGREWEDSGRDIDISENGVDGFDHTGNEMDGNDNSDSFDGRGDDDPYDDNDADTNQGGGDSDRSYPMPTDSLDFFLKELGPPVKNYIGDLNLKFVINPDLVSDGGYTRGENLIEFQSTEISVNTFSEEVWHSIQDHNDILVKNLTPGSTNCEFEAKVMVMIENMMFENSAGTDVFPEMYSWLRNDVIRTDRTIDRESFKEGIQEYYKDFLETNKQASASDSRLDAYWKYDAPDWDWNWDIYFDILENK